MAAGATRYGINARLVPAGHVTGTVTDASAAGLGGIVVQVYRDAGSGDRPWEEVVEQETAADGAYDIGGLPAGSYRIAFWDQSGVYVEQFYNNKMTMQAGDDVVVNGGATRSDVNARLALAGHVTGRVTQELGRTGAGASGAGLGGIYVTAGRNTGSGDFPWEGVRSTETAADGTYDLGGLPAGTYRIEFYDDSGNHVLQYYNNQPTIDLGEDVVVTAGGTRSGIDARLALAGHVGGTVTDASADGLGGIWVTAVRPDGSGGWEEVWGTQTGADGTYDLGFLPTGRYRIQFSDDSGNYVRQYYNNKPTAELGDDVAVTAGAMTSGIDATMAAAAPFGAPLQGASLPGLDLGKVLFTVK